jgi:hypothetical protein
MPSIGFGTAGLQDGADGVFRAVTAALVRHRAFASLCKRVHCKPRHDASWHRPSSHSCLSRARLRTLAIATSTPHRHVSGTGE